jgi:hypothetical protein
MLGNRIQYAVIETVYSATSERFVVAYATRKSLTALIAQSRIVVSALESRSEAEELALAFCACSPASLAGIALQIRTKARRFARQMDTIARQLAFVPDSLRATYSRAVLAFARR